MTVLKQLLMVLLLAIWLPAMNHCTLEIAKVIPADECCSSEETESAPHSCERGCDLIEKAGFKNETQKRFAAVCPLLPLLFQSSIASDIRVSQPEVIACPAETVDIPQFFIKTALPIRAPSFA